MGNKMLPMTATEMPVIKWRKCSRPSSTGSSLNLHPVSVDVDMEEDLAKLRIYRYCSIPEALGLLERKEWSFLHPSIWQDPYEKHLSDQLFGDKCVFGKLGVFAKCLSLDFRSNALWSMYAGNAGVVRIGLTMKVLIRELGRATITNPCEDDEPISAKFYLARCRYMEPQDIRTEVKCAFDMKATSQHAMRAITMKRDGFQYENELRVALVGKPSIKDNQTLRRVAFHRSFVKSILIDPYLQPHDADPLVALFQRLAPGSEVRQSGFNATPGG